MKTSYSLAFFIIALVVAAGLFFIFTDSNSKKKATLLQTLECHEDKIDRNIYNLDADTTLIGAMISFRTVPINQETRQKMQNLNIALNEKSWIFDYVLAQIPTSSLCSLAQDEAVQRVFIPNFN